MIGNPVQPVQDGPQQLMQPRERELGLRLDAARAQDQHALRPARRVLEQRRLPHTRLPPQHEPTATKRARTLEQARDHRLLGLPTAQPHTPQRRAPRASGPTTDRRDQPNTPQRHASRPAPRQVRARGSPPRPGEPRRER